jgi:integral membrane protein (TIGR00529 family)
MGHTGDVRTNEPGEYTAMIVDFLLSAPALAKVLGTLALILILNGAAKNLVAAIAAGALVLGLWSGQPLVEVGRIAWARFSSLDNLLLMVVICQIIGLSTLMAKTGVMQDMVQSVRERVPHRMSFAALPAVIGLLPMPGGAMFSAPMVASADRDEQLPSLLKTQTNYWFRHVWEYWWPLYPGVILTLDMTGLEIWQLIPAQLPVSVLAIAAGYLFLLRRIPRNGGLERGAEKQGRSFFVLIAPIITVILTYAAILIVLPSVKSVSRYIPIMAGLFLALFVLQIQRRPGRSSWREVLLSRRTLYMTVLVAVIRIYGAMIEARLPGGMLLVEQMRSELTAIGLPEGLFIILIPLIAGLAVGINVGTIGASLPVVMSLLGASPPLILLLPTAVLAYAAGFMGQMLSPVHVCLVVTNQYFKTSLLRSLAGLILPVLFVLVGTYGYSHLLRLVTGG